MCAYIAEMQNFVPETCYFVPSSAGEFNAFYWVRGGVGGWGHLGIEIFFVAEVVQKLG